MKKAISIQSIILIFATLISLAITIYVGSFSIDTATFYSKALLVNITFMGDAFFAFGIVFFLLFFFNKKSMASKLLIAILISLSITQVIKNIFSGLPLQLFFEEGVLQNPSEALFNENIISSHTAIAFTLASFFVLSTKNIFFKMSSILLAFTVAITRVELAGDSLLALAIGLLPATISLLYLYNMKQKKQTNKHAYYYKSRKENKGSAQQLLRV
jgi:PAP2 superfamily